MAFVHRFSPPQLVQSLALLAIVAGVATWSSLLLTPPSRAPRRRRRKPWPPRPRARRSSGFPTSRWRWTSRSPG